MSFSQQWNDTKAADRNKPNIPDGKYNATMVDIKKITAKRDGRDWIVAEFRIADKDGRADNQKFSKFYGFEGDSLSYLKTDLALMEREIAAPTSEDDLVQKLYDLCPVTCEVAISSKLDKGGTMRTNAYINGPATTAVDEDQLPF